MPPKPLPDDPDLLAVPVDTGENDIVLGVKKKKPQADAPAPVADASVAMAPPPPPPPPGVGLPPPPSPMTSPTLTLNSPPPSSSNSFGGFTGPSAPMNEQEYQMAKARLELEKERMDESWVKQYWRPAMGWLYMLICLADFVIFPALTIFLPVIFKAFGIIVPYVPWKSITLENGGLVHMAFGAILGVAAWTRGQEKIQGKA